MKRLALVILVVCVGVAGCDDDDATAPSDLPLVFSALLSPASEIPLVTNAESSGRGAFQVSIMPTRSASGAITAATADFHIQLYGFPNDVPVTGAHIHEGTSNIAGPVRINSGVTPGQVALGDGTLTLNIRNITVDPAVAQRLIDNPSGWYFNIHSVSNPGGFARGQLSRVQ